MSRADRAGARSLCAVVAAALCLAWSPGARTKSEGCHADGPRPDPECTPGAVETTSRAVVCGTATTTRRRVSEEKRRRVLRSYGVPLTEAGHYEIDHLIPLELGGSNDVANLWPEAAPGYHAKDKVENYLHARVCEGSMSIEAAQRAMATDWTAVRRGRSTAGSGEGTASNE